MGRWGIGGVTWTTRLRWCARTTKTNKTLNGTVGRRRSPRSEAPDVVGRGTCAGLTGPVRAAQVHGPRRLGNLDAQLLQLPVNPGRAPQGVRRDIRRMSARTSGATAGGRAGPAALPGPEEPEAGPLPPDHRLGLDDGDGIRPPGPQAGEQDPKQAVGGSPAWARRGPLEDGQLVPQREVLEHQGALGPKDEEEAGEDEGQHPGHHRSGRPEPQC